MYVDLTDSFTLGSNPLSSSRWVLTFKYVIYNQKAPTEIRQLWNVHFLILSSFNSSFEVKSTCNEIVRSEKCKSGDFK